MKILKSVDLNSVPFTSPTSLHYPSLFTFQKPKKPRLVRQFLNLSAEQFKDCLVLCHGHNPKDEVKFKIHIDRFAWKKRNKPRSVYVMLAQLQ